MKRNHILLLSAAIVPLLLVAWFLVLKSPSSDAPASSESQGFVHPPVSTPRSDGMLRAQAPAAQAIQVQEPVVRPTSDNVNARYYEQIFVLEERIKTVPDDTTALAKLGRLYQSGHAFSEAEASYSAYLALRPEGRQVWIDLTAVYAGLEDWDQARSTLDNMLIRFPGDESALYNLGALSANAGDLASARSQWQSLLDSTDDDDLADRLRMSIARVDALGS